MLLASASPGISSFQRRSKAHDGFYHIYHLIWLFTSPLTDQYFFTGWSASSGSVFVSMCLCCEQAQKTSSLLRKTKYKACRCKAHKKLVRACIDAHIKMQKTCHAKHSHFNFSPLITIIIGNVFKKVDDGWWCVGIKKWCLKYTSKLEMDIRSSVLLYY